MTAGEADESRIALKRSFRIVVFGGCNMRVLRQSSYIESSARPRECHLKLGGCHGNKKESRENQAKCKKTPVTKTGTPTKTKTAGYERVTALRPSVNHWRPDALPCLDTRRSAAVAALYGLAGIESQVHDGVHSHGLDGPSLAGLLSGGPPHADTHRCETRLIGSTPLELKNAPRAPGQDNGKQSHYHRRVERKVA